MLIGVLDEMFLRLNLIFLLLGGVGAAEIQESCLPENGDAATLMSQKIVSVSYAAHKLKTTVEVLRAKVTEQVDKIQDENDELKKIAKGVDDTAEYSGKFKDARRTDTDLYGDVFRHACPYTKYLLRPSNWSFLKKQKTFCWPLYPIWVTSCVSKYCNCNFSSENWYLYFYNKCFTEWRYIKFPATCLKIKRKKWQWKTEWMVRLVPRGCCCQKRDPNYELD